MWDEMRLNMIYITNLMGFDVPPFHWRTLIEGENLLITRKGCIEKAVNIYPTRCIFSYNDMPV